MYINKRSNFEFMVFLSVRKHKCCVSCLWLKNGFTVEWWRCFRLQMEKLHLPGCSRHSAKYLEGRTERHSFTGSIANLKHMNIHVLELRAGGQSQEQSLCSYSHLSEEPFLGTQATAGNKIFEMNLQVIVCAFERLRMHEWTYNLLLLPAKISKQAMSSVMSSSTRAFKIK